MRSMRINGGRKLQSDGLLLISETVLLSCECRLYCCTFESGEHGPSRSARRSIAIDQVAFRNVPYNSNSKDSKLSLNSLLFVSFSEFRDPKSKYFHSQQWTHGYVSIRTAIARYIYKNITPRVSSSSLGWHEFVARPGPKISRDFLTIFFPPSSSPIIQPPFDGWDSSSWLSPLYSSNGILARSSAGRSTSAKKEKGVEE